MIYTQIATDVLPDSVIIFQEYELDRHEHKHLSYEIGPVPVQVVIPPHYSLCRVDLEKYYSSDLTDLDYCQLSCINDTRIILRIGLDEENRPIYKPIIINQDFFNLGLQILEIVSAPSFGGGVVYDSYYPSR